MSNKVQVRLQDGTYTNFTAFAVDNGDGTIKEFGDYDLAKAYLQQLEQDDLFNFMKDKKAFISFTNHNNLSLLFINWYVNLNCFDKSEFLKLLQNVYKIVL